MPANDPTVKIDRFLGLHNKERPARLPAGALAQAGAPPEPLSDSPKCPRCSLVGICQPDEIAFLRRQQGQVRPLYVADSHALPLYVQTPRAWLRSPRSRRKPAMR